MYRSHWIDCFFFAQIYDFIKRFEALSKVDEDKDEIAAGVNRVQRFGVFATMDTLTNGDLTKHEEYWKLPVELIYTKLLYNKSVREFQEDYRKIKETQDKQNAKLK